MEKNNTFKVERNRNLSLEVKNLEVIASNVKT